MFDFFDSDWPGLHLELVKYKNTGCVVLHYALFLLRFATIHVMAKTKTRTTTVAATTTMTLNDVVPAENI